MAMTKKDFEAVAKEIRSHTATDEWSEVRYTVTSIARGLANVFAESNPRFDRERFLKACGVED